jgi:hypothetical protein
MLKLSASLAELQKDHQENSVKAMGEGEANAAIQKATWEKANKEIADLAHKLMEAEAKVEHEAAVKSHLEVDYNVYKNYYYHCFFLNNNNNNNNNNNLISYYVFHTLIPSLLLMHIFFNVESHQRVRKNRTVAPKSQR